MLAKSISGAAAAVQPAYIEDVFSTYLHTGNGSTQTITNGIDLSTKGGMVWVKARSVANTHRLLDTARGVGVTLQSQSSSGNTTQSAGLTAFNSNGFSLGSDPDYNNLNDTYVSWTFRKQAKFFDVVTYTGTGANRTISHNLGSTPGCIIVKRTDTTGSWQVYHNGLTSAAYTILLNSTGAQVVASDIWNSTAPTSTVFSVGTNTAVNASGGTYVAYLFAHNAGGFGNAGTDNVISCGSFTTTTAGNYRTELGYEPQRLLVKRSAGGVSNWWLLDTMRGFNLGGNDAYLEANSTIAETTNLDWGSVDATGFTLNGLSASSTYIYIAIRRGPMRTPTSGTSVFTPVARAGTSAAASISSGFVTDLIFDANRTGGASGWWDRLRGPTLSLSSYGSAAEFTDSQTVTSFASMTGVSVGSDTTNGFINLSPNTYVNYMLRRAPGFFDEVCYSGSGTDGRTVNHNLGVSPELIIIKSRTSSPADYGWVVSSSYLTGGITTLGRILYLNTTAAQTQQGWVHTATSTTFKVEGANQVNSSLSTYVAYLFASCPSVSKVGSYTGTGATQTISCGFTGGARFVLIKRTDSTGDWYVWDTARGMVSGTDPSLLLNSTAAEVNANSVYTTTGGFQIVSTAAGINASGGTYIFLAVS